jgi:hypothetical protein
MMSIIQPDERSVIAQMSAGVASFRSFQIGDVKASLSLLPLFLQIAKRDRPTAVGDLARMAALSSSVVSKQLVELGDHSLGLVRREIVGAHTLISLTSTGEALARRMANAVTGRSDMARAA